MRRCVPWHSRLIAERIVVIDVKQPYVVALALRDVRPVVVQLGVVAVLEREHVRAGRGILAEAVRVARGINICRPVGHNIAVVVELVVYLDRKVFAVRRVRVNHNLQIGLHHRERLCFNPLYGGVLVIFARSRIRVVIAPVVKHTVVLEPSKVYVHAARLNCKVDQHVKGHMRPHHIVVVDVFSDPVALALFERDGLWQAGFPGKGHALGVAVKRFDVYAQIVRPCWNTVPKLVPLRQIKPR